MDYTDRKDISFKESLLDFTQNTTCHGVRHIFGPHSIFRRIMWLLFVLGCLAAVVIQIVDRIQYFSTWPMNVNVKINYNQTLEFPAVTICNQNAFRATEAARHGYYRLIEDMFSKSHAFTTSDLDTHNATNLSREELYSSLAHRKEDLILNCEWNKVKCSMEDFEMIMTDHGVCYIFKTDRSDINMLVSSSGLDSGLRLTLNVEQYEYMTGPNDAAGMKILLHNHREKPFVHELGQAVPTGSHAFVGVKFMTIDNMPAPYGECDFKPLRHTDYYTTEECYADCLVGLAATTCGCRDSYMPHVNGLPPVCTLQQYYGCLQHLKDEFNRHLRDKCDCPVPCKFALFDPSVSYATISNHVVDKLLTNSETSSLKDKLLQASEVSERMDKLKFRHFQDMADDLSLRYSDIKDVLEDILSCLEEHINTTKHVYADMMDVYNTKERLYRFQEYAVQKNFLRGREAMEERTLRTLVSSYSEFAMKNSRRIRRLAAMNETKVSEREELLQLIFDSLQVKKEVVEMSKANISLLLDAFINGTGIFNYKFEKTGRSHNPFIVPKPLLNESMHHNWYMLKYVPKLSRDLDRFTTVLDMFVDLANTAYHNNTVNETRLNYVYERYQYSARTFMFSKSVVYSQGIELPLKILKERHLEYDNTRDEFETGTDVLNQNVKSLLATLSRINTTVLPAWNAILSSIKQYIDHNTISLMDLAEIVLSNQTQEIESETKNFFQEVQTRGQTINDAWSLLTKPTHALWDKAINDEDMLDYYIFTNNTRFQQNFTDVVEEYDDKFDEIKNMDVRVYVSHKDEKFFLAFEEITNHLDGFKDSIKVDSNFLRQNFLQLDIFFRQLSYEQITQQKAYDFFALICDIGGSLGLFIGASMLTILEILDLFIIQLPIFKRQTKKQKQKISLKA